MDRMLLTLVPHDRGIVARPPPSVLEEAQSVDRDDAAILGVVGVPPSVRPSGRYSNDIPQTSRWRANTITRSWCGHDSPLSHVVAIIVDAAGPDEQSGAWPVAHTRVAASGPSGTILEEAVAGTQVELPTEGART
ncbi:MAG: hypothetical protein ABSE70_11980 [Candidatus Limnocylindrales bacterium]